MGDFAQRLFTYSPDVIYAGKANDDFGVTFISENVAARLGYQPDDFLDDPGFWQDHIHPEDSPKVLIGIEAIFKDGHHVHEYRFKAKNGEYRWLRDEVRLTRNQATGKDELLGFWLDITDRKTIEENYRRFARLTSDYVHCCTRTGTDPFRIQWLDGATKTISGYSTQDILEMGCWLPLVHPRDCQTVASYLFNLIPGDMKELEFRIVTKGQEVRWVSEKSSCEAGQAAGELILYGAVTDITERKKLMEEHGRATQLAALGTVAAGVAHEINNPIQGIINYATLLQNESQLSARGLDIAQRIGKEGDRIAKITRNLLDYAKDNRKEIKICNIAELTESVLTLMSAKVKSSGIIIESDLAADLPQMSLNPQGFQQIVINLVDNAYDALRRKEMPVEEKIIHIHGSVIDLHDQPHLLLEVCDNGIGMAQDVLEKAKDAFFSTKPSSEGTGLGLSIVTEILVNHKGQLHLDSLEGEYTKVQVLLPVTT